ncbi:cyclase family protein [Clostridium rectalis]|uniref:cyclase family protein n=1 Tax=Clostridium rectalis TaxID=2040295 RepID=UPI000F6323E9|nr:cyclase family protein [Clostridium rectalis]
MAFIDLSYPIDSDMITYCEKERTNIYNLSSINTEGYNVKKLSITTHTSTHVDAPNHIIENGLTIDKIPLDNFYGQGIIIDCRNIKSQCIDIDILNNYNLSNKDFILFYTGHDRYWGTVNYLSKYKYMSNKLCYYMSSLDIKGVGIDTISIDSESNITLNNHNKLLKNNKLIIENLANLNFLVNKSFELFLFPLKIQCGDGSPVRSVAKTYSL